MNKIFLNFIDCLKLYRIIEDKIQTKFFYGRRDKILYDSANIYMGVRNFESIYVPAYTDAELNEILPDKIIFRQKTVKKDTYDLVIRKTRHGKYVIEYENQIKEETSLVQIFQHTEVEAKAHMIFFLNKKNLLK